MASGCDALHPGYGFLSENPALPEACAAAGIVWVGPPIEAMRVMGHKARAKEVVAAAGVPVLPSALVESGAPDEALAAAAAAVGLPLLVKASAGGGGRGMRLVERVEDLAEAVASAQREAAAAFGSDEVFLERYLATPRHVEVQIIGDTRRHRAPPLRPRVLGAAAPPEGGGGGAGASSCPRRSAGRCGTPPSPPRPRSATRAWAPSSSWSTRAASSSSK